MQKVVDKAISPAELIKALQTGSITIAQAQQIYNGVIPIGDYKGIAALLDINLLVNQPLVLAEEAYNLDKLDTRDVVTVSVPVGAVPATGIFTAAFTVPALELWLLTQMAVACPVTAVAGETIAVNVRLSNWQIPDVRAGTVVNVAGRSYYVADLVATSAAAIATTTVFNAVTELGKFLRLASGTVITLVASSTGNAITVAKAVTLILYGRKITKLVE